MTRVPQADGVLWLIQATIAGFAPGDLGFAASYAACRGVFGFHDPCRDLKANTVCSYLVTGWFSDPAADPLAEDKADALDRLRWALADPAGAQPKATTCYAIARSQSSKSACGPSGCKGCGDSRQ